MTRTNERDREAQSISSVRRNAQDVPDRRSWAWKSLDVDQRWELSLELGPVHPTLGTPCIFYTAGSNRYGYIGHDGKSELAHRFAYARDVGPIPPGYDVSHLCARTRCVNALGGHLVVEPGFINQHRYTIQYRAQTETQCIHGHPWSKATLYIAPNGSRACRACQTLGRRGENKNTPIDLIAARPHAGRPPTYPVVDGKKVCLCCGQLKLLKDFAKDSRVNSGISGTCKTCKAKRQALWLAGQTPQARRARRVRQQARTAPRRVRGPVHPVKRGKKVCLKCEFNKPVSCFFADKRRKDGISPLCKACEGERQEAWRTNRSSLTKVA